MSQYTWVERSEDLARLCQQWSKLSHVGLDTEFIRERTFYPIAALIQVNDGDANYLIDPTVIDDLSPLKTFLQDTECIKVMHSCSEDLEVFAQLLGGHVEPLADTQVAGALLGLGVSMGYANICKSQLGIDVDKGETRSNWLQRPLTESQRHYAALDVEHLLPLYDTLLDQLEDEGKADMFDQECERIEFQATQSMDFQEAYTRIKAGWKMPAHKLNRLRSLAAWREEQARLRDIPRNHVIRDSGLINLVESEAKSVDDLKGLQDVSPPYIRKYGEKILELLQQADLQPREQWPERMDKPLSKGQAKLMSQFKHLLTEKAEAMMIAPELLGSKRDVEPVIRASIANQPIDLDYLRSPWRINAYCDVCKTLNIAFTTRFGDAA